VGNLEPEIKVGATQAVQEKTFKDQTLFTRLRQGLWGADEKSLLADVMKDRYGDVAYKDYYDFYSNFIDSAYNYSGTPAQKITNLLNNLYPNFVEDPLMQDNDYQAFADFGEDILDAVVFGIYSEFMVGVNTLPKDSDKYWTYMDTIVLSSLTKGLSGDKTYSDRTSNYMQLTLFTILSAPYCALDWGAFKEWKENADNINKTYKDFAFEKWLAKNPNKGKKSSEELFDDYSSEMWRSFVASDTSKTSAVKADSIYNFIWEPRRKARGF
jgi:hypothetical protein